MKLTSKMRSALLDIIMSDILLVDHNGLAEALVNKVLFNDASTAVKGLYSANPDWLKESAIVPPEGLNLIFTRLINPDLDPTVYVADRYPELWENLRDWGGAAMEQRRNMSLLRDDIASLLSAFPTVKALRKGMPQFSQEVSDRIKKAGWKQ